MDDVRSAIAARDIDAVVRALAEHARVCDDTTASAPPRHAEPPDRLAERRAA